MKKLLLIPLFFFCTTLCFAETNEITFDNSNHRFDDYYKVANTTSEIIYIEIFIKRKVNTLEQKIGSAIVPPHTKVRINTIVDGQFDEYDFIKVQTSGIIKDYSIRQKNSDVILTINSYSGPENDILLKEGLLFENEVLFDISSNKYRDYVFIRNKINLFIHCLLYGITKDTGKEIFIGKGLIEPNTKIRIETFYDDKLKDLKSIRLRTDIKLLDSESICSSHDMNITIYAAEGEGAQPLPYPEPPTPPETGTIKDFIYL